ncbi:endonuclease III [Candidatus Peribacteria bacterium RIFOXYC1_FULL_58_8]|nr:MAG: endonuclease III [Candidatus Peribacteria bacterium RIFOXYC1_FULL_58_8]
MKRKRALEILRRLSKKFPDAKIALKYSNPIQLTVAVILSAQCTDKKVNEVTAVLFKKYKTAKDFAKANLAVFEREIRPTGFYRAKARNIIAAAKLLESKFGGKLPKTMEEMTSLSGVGRKTACIVLYAAFGKNEGIAVDTHVFRVARRLGLSKGRTPERVERDLMKLFPRKEWGRINALFISHGRAVCTGQRRKCEQCVFKRECPSSLVSGKRDWAK